MTSSTFSAFPDINSKPKVKGPKNQDQDNKMAQAGSAPTNINNSTIILSRVPKELSAERVKFIEDVKYQERLAAQEPLYEGRCMVAGKTSLIKSPLKSYTNEKQAHSSRRTSGTSGLPSIFDKNTPPSTNAPGTNKPTKKVNKKGFFKI